MAEGPGKKKGTLRDVARKRANKKPAASPTPARPSRRSTPRPAAPKPQQKPPAPASRPAPSRRSTPHARGGTLGRAPAERKPPTSAAKTPA
ncbi:MAG: hypothetical protein RRC07_13175, partial [Anaerolineae bacterium]|nr:hypothetical protein [Anaerolineae bacterium]